MSKQQGFTLTKLAVLLAVAGAFVAGGVLWNGDGRGSDVSPVAEAIASTADKPDAVGPSGAQSRAEADSLLRATLLADMCVDFVKREAAAGEPPRRLRQFTVMDCMKFLRPGA